MILGNLLRAKLGRATWAPIAAIVALFVTPSAPANAMKIQAIKSPGGIEAWLVEEHAVPMMAMRFAFDGGSSQDPDGKEGLANFVTAMLDEGAGDCPREVPGARGGPLHAHELRGGQGRLLRQPPNLPPTATSPQRC